MRPKGSDIPLEAEILALTQETPSIFTLDLQLTDVEAQHSYLFQPGQFNMVYLWGVGEVAISILSLTATPGRFQHTIRAVGRVTHALKHLKVGDCIGICGPFGRGWPLSKAQGQDIIILTGGLGCAPVVSVIHYILAHRELYGNLYILQGVKHSDDFIFKKQYDLWQQAPRTFISIAANQAGPSWPWSLGRATDALNTLNFNQKQTVVMMCGPEGMMHSALPILKTAGICAENIYLSMERNMVCGMGHCGHCQYGGKFLCKDGPVFSYPEVASLFDVAGF